MRPSASAKPRKEADVPSADGPDVESRLLARAQDALRSNPASALAIADEHARRFPLGMLAQKREVLGIDGLVGLGRLGDAKARAGRFRARFPDSTHNRRIDEIVGD
jgi:hypothetical protein